VRNSLEWHEPSRLNVQTRIAKAPCNKVALGPAARFVTGYLHIPTEATDDFQGGGNTHAWCQVYLPGAGWVEFDPTNGIVGNRDLVRVAVARDAGQAIPLHGCYYGNAEDDLGMEVSVTVRRLTSSSNDRIAPC